MRPFEDFIGRLPLRHRLHAETTDEFNQWARDYEVTPVALVIDENRRVMIHLLDERDVVAFKMRWL